MDAFCIVLLVWCSYTDIRNRTVSNLAVVLMLCLGIVHTAFILQVDGTWWTYPTGMVFAIPFFISWLRGGMGAGDVKLVIVITLYLGLLNAVIAFALMVLALAVLMARSWIKARTLKRAIPLAPVLAFGAISAVALGYLFGLLQV